MNLWLYSLAWAHRPGLSYARLDAHTVSLTFATPELAARIPLGDDLEASRVLIRQITLDQVSLSVGGHACTIGEASLRHVEGDGVEISAPLDCDPGSVTYTASFLAQMEAGHRHYVEALGQPVAVLDVSSPTVTYTGASDRTDVALRFGKLGVEHIWTGYDHLLFLTGLLLAAPSLRAMLFVVTGFTIAHSITLSAAALGLVSIPPRIVEPAIAASIAFVGIENFWRPAPKRRVVVTFLLGLIHGFGFAGLLIDLGLPRDALAAALVSFNGGVEVGQAAVVAVVLPLLLFLRRYPWWEKRAVPACSVGVSLAGVYWLVERLGG
jgi:hydrogenase/urease accessory protein HupE